MTINETGVSESVTEKELSPDLGRLMKTIESNMIAETDGSLKQIEGESKKKAGDPLYIPFLLGNIRFAVLLADTLEVGKSMPVTPLPNLPVWVRGIGNIRGEVISVVDLKVFFGSAGDSVRPEEYIIVLSDGRIKTGVIVDRLLGVKAFEKSDSRIVDNPYPDSDIRAYINGVIIDEAGIMNVLDTGSLLGSDRMNAFR